MPNGMFLGYIFDIFMPVITWNLCRIEYILCFFADCYLKYCTRNAMLFMTIIMLSAFHEYMPNNIGFCCKFSADF